MPLGDILVVDDQPGNLTAVDAILEEFPSRIVRALSGAEALRQLLERDFALVLLDVQMPEMDGFETARLIRQRQRSRHTPIIFLTAHPSESADILRAYELGAVDFLFKPIIPEVLRAKVTVLLELQRRTIEVTRQAELLREHERREHERQLSEERRHWEAEALRLQMEEERRAAVELAKRAAELTRMVTELERAERELTRINRELEAVDRRKDEFLAVLAHELRNPLAPVVSGIDLLRTQLPEGNRGQRVNRALGAMDRQLQHLVRLVDDLLDVSRINSGKIALKREVVDLREVIEQAISATRPLVEERGQELRVSIASEPVCVNGDSVRLAQVVSNLLNNASRYTTPGGALGVQLETADEQAVIRVWDNGQGIPGELLDSVFDMFVQQNNGGGGLGVGLALVKRLVDLHGGSVSVKSEGTGRGSKFDVRLPVAAALPVRSEAPERARQSDAGPLRIVVIDDNPDIRDLVADLLASHGHDVSQAATGKAALELIQQLEPDAALVDLGLPDVDGWAIAKSVRQNAKTHSIRLVAMSGYGSDADRARAFEAGFDAHIVKPAHIDEILRALTQAPSAAPTNSGSNHGASARESQHP